MKQHFVKTSYSINNLGKVKNWIELRCIISSEDDEILTIWKLRDWVEQFIKKDNPDMDVSNIVILDINKI